MKVAVGHSTDPKTCEAMDEVIQQCRTGLGGRPAHAGIVFAAMDVDHQEMLTRIHAEWPDIALIGCTTDGELSSCAAFQEDSIALMVFHSDNVIFRAGIGDDVSQSTAVAAQSAIEQASWNNECPKLVVTLPESLTVSGVSVVNALNEQLAYSAPIVGGTSGDQWEFAHTHQFFGTRVCSDTLPVLAFFGDVEVSVGVASGWEGMGTKATVDEADGNIVRRIDGKPAVDYYRDHLGMNFEFTPEYPLSLVEQDGSMCLRAPLGYDAASGAITFAGDVSQGALVQITWGGRDKMIDACESSANDALSRFGEAAPDAVLVFSCAARKQLLGTRTAEEYGALSQRIPANTPVVGFYSYGEIAPFKGTSRAHFHNETFVTVFLRGM